MVLSDVIFLALSHNEWFKLLQKPPVYCDAWSFINFLALGFMSIVFVLNLDIVWGVGRSDNHFSFCGKAWYVQE